MIDWKLIYIKSNLKLLCLRGLLLLLGLVLFIAAVLSPQARQVLIKSLLAIVVNSRLVVSQFILPPGLERHQVFQRDGLGELSPEPEP